MRSRLFLKVYATLVAAIAVVALLGALVVRLGQDDDERGWAGRRDGFLAAMLPEASDPAALRLVLGRLGQAFGADITVFDASGRGIASTGKPFSPAILRTLEGRDRAGGPFRFVTALPDGRIVAARMDRPFGPGGRRRNPLLTLALIAGVTGLAAYPFVRHLTRRLERLRNGVEAWGAGDLALRVTVDGRDEVAAVASTFNGAAGRIERLVRSHRSLLANASHELRSPLARLRMAIDLFEQSPAGKLRDEIVRDLAELDGLVEEILLASRLDHAETAVSAEPVDLLALAAEEGARNGVAVTGEAALVQGDPRLLTRMVRNLMQNALRHGAPPVKADVRRAGGYVELSVRDHGSGIPANERERVFEPFYRPAGRGEAAGGWGLGLSLVRQIAGRHGATARQETPAGGGARFVIRFPPPRDRAGEDLPGRELPEASAQGKRLSGDAPTPDPSLTKG